MSITKKQYQDAWNKRVGPATAHLDLSFFMQDHDNRLYDIFEHFVRKNIKPDDVILDFGSGGGWLARYLLNKRTKFKNFVGLDISERSIEFSKCNVEHSKVEFIEIDPFDYAVKKYNPSIIVCLSVLQHMPTIEIVAKALDNFNLSGAERLIIQIRVGNENFFQKNVYKTTHEINMANRLTKKYLFAQLNNYEMKKEETFKDYAYFYFERNISVK